MLILITIDHFLSENDIIKYFTYEFVGWVTAAEGFVFLSGLTAGIVYTRQMLEKGEEFVSAATTKRAWLIYRNHIAILFFAFIAVLFGFGLNEYWVNHYSLFSESPYLSIFLGATLLYQPIYLDILPMYAAFIFCVPVVIKYLKKGFIWQLFACSIILYMIPIFKGSHVLTDITQIKVINTGFFNLLSWQFLFFLGLFSGFSYCCGKVNKWMNNKKLLLLLVFLCSALFLIKNLQVDLSGLDYLFSRDTLGPIRLLNSLSIFFIITFICARKSEWFTFKPICYLGRNSLEVFSFHVLFVIIFKPLNDIVSNIYSIKVTDYFFVYPLALIMFILFVIPALFLAPTLLRSRTYTLSRNNTKPLYNAGLLANASVIVEDSK
ncbi:OpgC domain-containing protein [Hymenobacter sp. BT188]|nr:OpgC domain-containing protein [Hymenobacter sp. BT188]